jgi:hypothetical protein
MSTIHNPANVPESALPDGYRFLDTDEVKNTDYPFLKELKTWDVWLSKWTFFWRGTDPCATYCTSLSRAELRALRGLPPEEPAPTPAESDQPVDSDEVKSLKARIAELEAQLANDDLEFLDRAALAALTGLMANPGGPIQANGTTGWGLCNCDLNYISGMGYHMANLMLAERRRVREVMRKEGAR